MATGIIVFKRFQTEYFAGIRSKIKRIKRTESSIGFWIKNTTVLKIKSAIMLIRTEYFFI
jgi:hypothetical protein